MKKILWILVVGWMAFIFYQGTREIEVSMNNSNQVLETVVNVVEQVDGSASSSSIKHYNSEEKVKSEISLLNEFSYEQLSYMIRKSAHFFEYVVLAVLIGSLLHCYRYTWMNRIIYALFMVLLCAILDEYFQSFVDGRNSSVKDILIDFSGAIVGCLLLELMMITKIKIKSLFLSKVSSYKKC